MTIDTQPGYPHRSHRKEENAPKPFLRLRNVLNIIFIIGAVVGMYLYFFGNQTTGTIIILGAMAFKIVECSLRFIRR